MTTTAPVTPLHDRESRDSVVIRFSGDSGDGMQLTGTQFTMETALSGSDLATFPDYPAEIRAPAGTTFGVSSFQIHFGSQAILTAGDMLDVLVAMNPAALVTNIKDLAVGGLVVLDTGAFNSRNLEKAGYAENPIGTEALAPYRVLPLDITRLTQAAVKEHGVSSKEALRCRNMWALGLMLWMYDRDHTSTVTWLRKKFAKSPPIAEANIAALNAGNAFGETAEMPAHVQGYSVRPADLDPGTYRAISGTEALAFGLLAGVKKAGLKNLFFGSYPITPGVRTAARACRASPPRRHHLPGRRRNRGDLLGHRRLVHRRARRDVELGARHRAQDRGDGTRHQHRAAARHREQPARRAVDGHAHQDRAIGSLPGCLRPQRRQSARGHRVLDALGLLRGGHRSGAHRAASHDAGHPAHRRVPRQRGGALAGARSRCDPRFSGQVPHRNRGLPSLRARPRDPRARLGHSRHRRG